METVCPHCGKTIELVGASELKTDYEISSNFVQHQRSRGRFPVPWLSFGNRNIWLRDTISEYIEQRSRATIESTVKGLVGALGNLPDDEKEAALKILEEELGGRKRGRARQS